MFGATLNHVVNHSENVHNNWGPQILQGSLSQKDKIRKRLGTKWNIREVAIGWERVTDRDICPVNDPQNISLIQSNEFRANRSETNDSFIR